MIRNADNLIFYSGTSMWPTFRPGDRLVLKECDAATLRSGEVVVYRGRESDKAECRAAEGNHADAAKLVCHRVRGVTEREGKVFVRTQGDCSRKVDPEWPAERLVGRVVEVSPVKGRSRKLRPAPFLGWRLRHRLSVRRVLRALARRAGLLRRRRQASSRST